MKKLYKIIVLNAAPKSSHSSIETYLIAENDEQVFAYIDDNLNNNHWTEDCQDVALYNEYGNKIGTESFQKHVIRNRGDLDDDWGDAYYGVTKYAWEQGVPISDSDIEVLVRLGIAKVYNS